MVDQSMALDCLGLNPSSALNSEWTWARKLMSPSLTFHSCKLEMVATGLIHTKL